MPKNPYMVEEVAYCAGCGGEIYPGDPILEIAALGFKVVHYDEDNGKYKDECLKQAVNARQTVAVDRVRRYFGVG